MAEPKDPNRLIYYPADGGEYAPLGELRDRYIREMGMSYGYDDARARAQSSTDEQLIDDLYQYAEKKRRWKEQRLGPKEGEFPEGAHNFGFGRTALEAAKNPRGYFGMSDAKKAASVEAMGEVSNVLGWAALALGLVGLLAPEAAVATGAGATGAGAGATGAGATGAGVGAGATGAGAGAGTTGAGAAAAGAARAALSVAPAAGRVIGPAAYQAVSSVPKLVQAGEVLAKTASGLLALNGMKDMSNGEYEKGAAKIGLSVVEWAIPMARPGSLTRRGVGAAERMRDVAPYGANVGMQIAQEALLSLGEKADKTDPKAGDALRELASDPKKLEALAASRYAAPSQPSPAVREATREATGYNLGLPETTAPVPSVQGLEDDPSLEGMPTYMRK